MTTVIFLLSAILGLVIGIAGVVIGINAKIDAILEKELDPEAEKWRRIASGILHP